MDSLDKDKKSIEDVIDEIMDENNQPDEDSEAIDSDIDEIDADEAADDFEDAEYECLDEESEDGEVKKKVSLFQKKDKKKDKKDQQIEELNDRLIRNMAEFDNFRKRTDKEKSQMFEAGSANVIEKILPTIDDFERGLAAIPEEDKESSFATGMEMIYKKLMTTLTDIGVAPIEAVGQEFDPMLHNAVMQEASEEYETGVVTKELQKGYTYKEKVIRHSMVMVAE